MALMVMAVLGVVVIVTGTEDLTHSAGSIGFQAHYHCVSSDEKNETCVHDCDGGRGLFHRLGADISCSLAADTMLSISMSSMNSQQEDRLSMHDSSQNRYQSC